MVRRLTPDEMQELYAEKDDGALLSHGGLVNPYTDDQPVGWVQHKGSTLCMDIHCACGCNHHIDSDFCYEIRTPCGRIYSVGAYLPLFEVQQPSQSMPPRECRNEEWDDEGCRCADKT